jgi:uncharacterized membrane protein
MKTIATTLIVVGAAFLGTNTTPEIAITLIGIGILIIAGATKKD